MKLNKTIKLRHSYLGLAFCACVLALLAVATFCPFPNIGANAADGDETGNASTRATVPVHPMISMSVAANVNLDITPTSDGKFSQSEPINVSVTTNNASGYSLYVKSGNASGALEGTAANTDKITSVNNGSSTVASSGFGSNTWGYNVVDRGTAVSQFRGISSTAQKVGGETTNNAAKEYDLVIGAKVTPTIQSDVYSNSIILSVVANPLQLSNMSQVSFMQQLTPELCTASSEGTTRQMTDLRDGNVYWVSKLKDGNCWMVQNLALDIDKTKGLTADLTAIPEDWNAATNRCKNLPDGTYCAPNTTETEVPAKPSGSIPQTDTRSWNLGKWILVDPEDGTVCSAQDLGLGGADQYDSVMAGGDLSTCAYVGFLDVSGSEWKPTFTAQKGTVSFPSKPNKDDAASVAAYLAKVKGENNGITATPNASGATLIAANTATKEYDPHYLIGNYYQFNTATAGYGGVRQLTADEIATIPASGTNAGKFKAGTSGANGTGTEIWVDVFDGQNGTKWIGVQNTNVEYSICPKGWKLPLSGNNTTYEFNGLKPLDNDNKNGSFYNMLVKYGLQSSVSSANYNIARDPLYFVRSGFMRINNESLRYAGELGDNWSEAMTDYKTMESAQCYYLYFNANELSSSGGPWERWYGYPVRCLTY